jgi:methionyl-tRNA formyltransferase
MSGGIVVFAYSALGHACLKALIDRGEQVVALFTQADDPAERTWFDSCAALARQHAIPVYLDEPDSSERLHDLVAALSPDLIFSFYYRRMIPTAVLACASHGAFNMHGSLLPKYRGRAPVNWAVLHGERETGVTLHEMIGRADAGNIVDREAVTIGPSDTAGDVMEKLVPAAVSVLLRQIDALKAGCAPSQPQDEEAATYFGRRTPEDGAISWDVPAQTIVDLVRAVAPPFPGAFTAWNGARLTIARARVVAGSGAPGEIIGTDPLIVAAAQQAVELQLFDLAAADGQQAIARIKLGDMLGTQPDKGSEKP